MTDFVCEVDELYRSACEGLPFYAEHEGKRYCVLHYPGEDKIGEFRKAIESKVARKDYDFGGAVFPEGTSNFSGAKFDETVKFSGATFIGGAHWVWV
jgi:hypothetical protein